jgi:hypothetical protein
MTTEKVEVFQLVMCPFHGTSCCEREKYIVRDMIRDRQDDQASALKTKA